MHAEALIRAKKYAAAKTVLQSYLATASADQDALVLLGVADEYLNDSAGGVAALDAAGKIPDRYSVVAAKAHANTGDRANALPYVQRAKAHAGTDATLNADIDTALATLSK